METERSGGAAEHLLTDRPVGPPMNVLSQDNFELCEERLVSFAQRFDHDDDFFDIPFCRRVIRSLLRTTDLELEDDPRPMFTL